MDISGVFQQALQEQSGEGKNGRWVKCDFLIETTDRFPKKICFSAWGDLVNTVKGISAGSDVKVSFDVSSREYNGKWYTDVKAWKVDLQNEGHQAAHAAPSTQYEETKNDSANQPLIDDLPF